MKKFIYFRVTGNKRKRENQTQSVTIKEEKKISNLTNNKKIFATNNILNVEEKIGINPSEDLDKSKLNTDLVESHDISNSSINSRPQLSIFELLIII